MLGRLVTVPGIGARFGLEGPPFPLDVQTERFHHSVEDVVFEITHESLSDLERHVPVAEVVRGTGEKRRVIGPRRGHGLRRRRAP